MYDIVFESLRLLKSGRATLLSKSTGYSVDYILSIEKGATPSNSFVLDAASYYCISKSDIDKLNEFDDVNICMGMNHEQRYEEVKSVLLKYYGRGRDIGKSIIYKRR